MKYLKLYSNKLTASGATTATTASKLVDSGASFTTTVAVGDVVYNSTDDTTASVTAVDSDTTLSLSQDKMASGENYEIYKVNEYEKPRLIPVDKVMGLANESTFPYTNGSYIDFIISPEAGANNIRVNTNIYVGPTPLETIKSNFIVELEKLLDSSNKPIHINNYYLPKITVNAYCCSAPLIVRSITAQT